MDVIKDQVEVVWAKIKGYSWWPATMKSNSKATGTLDQKIRVQFFGEDSHSFVTSKMIADFREHFKEFSNTRNKKLLRSIKMAEEFEQQLLVTKLDKDTPTTTHQPCSKFQSVPIQEEEPIKNLQLSDINIQQSKSNPIDAKSFVAQVMENEEASKNNTPQPKRFKNIRKIKSDCHTFNRIPYRKFQDMKFECKIVDLINKLKTKKNCDIDLAKLLQRIPKITGKLQFNRYIISGIAVALKLLKNLNQQNDQQFSSIQCKQLIKEIEIAYNNLISNIRSEIHHTDQVRNQIEQIQNQPEDSNTFNHIQKKTLVKSIYKLLRQKKLEGRQLCQNVSIELCNRLQTHKKTINNNTIIQYKSAKELLRRISSSQWHSPEEILQDLTLKSA